MSATLSALWLETVSRAPQAAAVIDSGTGRIWTRAELDQAAEKWVSTLPPDTKPAGRRVALSEPNSAAWLVAFIGLLKAGAVVVPLDPADPLEARLATAEAVHAAWLWDRGSLRALPGRSSVSRGDLCLVKLTSGSTGTPRPLLFTHSQLAADARLICASMGIRPDDLNLGIIPFGHSYGLGNLIAPLLVQGTGLIAAASPLPHALAADCARWHPTVFPAVPTLLRALVLTEVEPSSIASLRLVISAGAPLSPDVADGFFRRFGPRIHSFYGSSETGGITYDRSGDATLEGRSVGTPLDGVTLQFRRGHRFEVSSPAVMGAGRYSPPDRAQLNAQGELVLLGRTGRIAKIGGRRLDLSEIEAIIRKMPGVVDVAAAPHPCRADSLAAVVAGKIEPAALRQALRGHVALWKIPERLLVLPELPRTSRGKVDRKKVLQLLAG